MCQTNVTHFLEILLQTPGIDINKPDVEKSTPLHYAAESGKWSVREPQFSLVFMPAPRIDSNLLGILPTIGYCSKFFIDESCFEIINCLTPETDICLVFTEWRFSKNQS